MELVELSKLTINLDNKRVPLNSRERSKKESKPLYPYIGANNIMGYIDEYIFDEKILCIAEDGGSWGFNQTCAKIYNEKCWVNNHAHVVTANDKVVLEYLMYYLNFADLSLYINGATRGKLTKTSLNSIKIPLPPLPTQKKIASILDEADTLRQLNKQLITKYDALTQSLFLEMFGDPVANPMGWEVKKMKEISTKIHSGNTPKGGSKVYVDKGIIFLRSQNVWKNRLELDDVAYIDEETQSRMMKSSLKNRDILMTKTGRINTENSSLGRAAMFEGEDDTANVNGHVYLIRLKEGVINEFVLHILTTNEYREHIRRVCVGGIDKRQLNKNHLEDFPIIYPPIEKQRKFITKLETIRELKQNVQQSLQKSEDLFNSLLQKAFKGELVK
ncbi:restriction endonuclease subunit S [Lacinutrix sp. C3R15]|uniref:restriction endonuclease subunit S n=1 Tax=Flavobacteriaceae TaxID=49546 RepID=UPI001C08150A|nr:MULTISPECIES: restriction endonuclease subunit S [Flavobacteriaceae]MBU2940164.1 restriction endonuclease subunit S [Lacinutrix sp. C3R15]MDO6623481.1 restriction endonuclease subunit S [Oceanihabitans sp. 1_MG-2023]